jgi:hypothetical protein
MAVSHWLPVCFLPEQVFFYQNKFKPNMKQRKLGKTLVFDGSEPWVPLDSEEKSRRIGS